MGVDTTDYYNLVARFMVEGEGRLKTAKSMLQEVRSELTKWNAEIREMRPQLVAQALAIEKESLAAKVASKEERDLRFGDALRKDMEVLGKDKMATIANDLRNAKKELTAGFGREGFGVFALRDLTKELKDQEGIWKSLGDVVGKVKQRFDFTFLTFIFGGMMLERFGRTILTTVLSIGDKITGQLLPAQKAVMEVAAAFEFMKFTMFTALGESAMFQNITKMMIEGLNAVSSYLDEHPLASDITIGVGVVSLFMGAATLFGGGLAQIGAVIQAVQNLLGFPAADTSAAGQLASGLKGVVIAAALTVGFMEIYSGVSEMAKGHINWDSIMTTIAGLLMVGGIAVMKWVPGVGKAIGAFMIASSVIISLREVIWEIAEGAMALPIDFLDKVLGFKDVKNVGLSYDATGRVIAGVTKVLPDARNEFTLVSTTLSDQDLILQQIKIDFDKIPDVLPSVSSAYDTHRTAVDTLAVSNWKLAESQNAVNSSMSNSTTPSSSTTPLPGGWVLRNGRYYAQGSKEYATEFARNATSNTTGANG